MSAGSSYANRHQTLQGLRFTSDWPLSFTGMKPRISARDLVVIAYRTQNQSGVLSVTAHRFPSMMSLRWLRTSARRTRIGRRAGLGAFSG